MLAKIRQGISLSEAMEAQGGAFPPLMIYMFRSAESGGNLDQVSLKMAELYEKDHKLNTKMAGAMIYPKILAGMIVAVILVLTKYVMPQFQELFEQMDTLPLSTRILNSISDFMQSYWYIAIILIVVLWAGAKALLTIASVRLKWHKIKSICRYLANCRRPYALPGSQGRLVPCILQVFLSSRRFRSRERRWGMTT